MTEYELAVAMKEDKLLNSLPDAEFNFLHTLLSNPMLSNIEIATRLGEYPSDVDEHYNAICKKIIPAEIYEGLPPAKRRMYILLKYTPPFREMSDSWHKTFIDPTFE